MEQWWDAFKKIWTSLNCGYCDTGSIGSSNPCIIGVEWDIQRNKSGKWAIYYWIIGIVTDLQPSFGVFVILLDWVKWW
jgi:hypothetical protein